MSTEDAVPIFYRVSPAYWMNRSWSDDMRLLGLYLLTSPHRSLEGLFWLPKQYIMGDLQWSPERLGKPFGQLTADGFLKYDEACEVALIVKALKYQKLPNPNMRVAALRRVQTVPQTRLDERFLASCEDYCEPLAQLLRERLPQRFGKPNPLLVLDLSSPNPLADDAPAPPADAPIQKTDTAPADDGFEDFWTVYPRKVGKPLAANRWRKLNKRDRAAATAAAGHLAAYVLGASVELQYVPQGDTFIGPKRTFEDWRDGPPDGYGAKASAPKRAVCPECETDLTWDERGERQHCPICDWRPTRDHQEATRS